MRELIEYKELREAIVRIRELHKPDENKKCTRCIAGYVSGYPYNYSYPCPTMYALDGQL